MEFILDRESWNTVFIVIFFCEHCSAILKIIVEQWSETQERGVINGLQQNMCKNCWKLKVLFNFAAISSLWEYMYMYEKKKEEKFWSLMCECWVLHRVFVISEWKFAKLVWKICGALKNQLFLLLSSQVCGYDLQCCDVFCLPSRLLFNSCYECVFVQRDRIINIPL